MQTPSVDSQFGFLHVSCPAAAFRSMSLLGGLVAIGSELCSERRNVVLVAMLVLTALTYELIASQLMTVSSSFYAAIADDDRRLFATTIMRSIAIVMILAAVKATRSMLREYSAMYWRLTLVNRISSQLLETNACKELYVLCPKEFLFSLDQR